MPPHLIRHLGRQPRPGVEHRQHHPEHLEPRVQRPRHQVQRSPQLTQPLERVVLTLDRHDHRLRRGQAVDGEQAKRGRAVEEQVVVPRDRRLQAGLQAALPRQLAHQLHLGPCQVHSGGHHPQVFHRGFHSNLGHRPCVAQAIVDAAGEAGLIHTQAAGGIALWVQIHKQHASAGRREAGAQVDGGGGLADATLLIHDCENAAHSAQVLIRLLDTRAL